MWARRCAAAGSGEKKCYVVRIDDPVTSKDNLAVKLQQLLPSGVYTPDNPQTWTGVGSLSVLEDVSFLATPDLPALCASQPVGSLGQPPVAPTGSEEFVVCSRGNITATTIPHLYLARATALDQ